MLVLRMRLTIRVSGYAVRGTCISGDQRLIPFRFQSQGRERRAQNFFPQEKKGSDRRRIFLSDGEKSACLFLLRFVRMCLWTQPPACLRLWDRKPNKRQENENCPSMGSTERETEPSLVQKGPAGTEAGPAPMPGSTQAAVQHMLPASPAALEAQVQGGF